MTALRFPWGEDPGSSEPAATIVPATNPTRRGRRPLVYHADPTSPNWIYQHVTVSGPAGAVAAFGEAARGPGIVPWRLDLDRIEEDIFHLAISQPAEQRVLTIAGCRILARQFREKVEARQARSAAMLRTSRTCPFDLQVLLPIPPDVLALGQAHPEARAWLAGNWGIGDQPRRIAVLDRPRGQVPAGQDVLAYGFFTADTSPEVAMDELGLIWPGLRFRLQSRLSG